MAQEIIYQESFETDGEGTRYTTDGSNVYEPARIVSELNRLDQSGPIYWARKSKVSFVGIPEATPARRALLCWNHNIAAAAVTPEFLALFDSMVKWLVKDKASATVLFSPPAAGPGDQVLIDRLTSKGHKVIEDEGAFLPARPVVDLIIASSSGVIGESPSRFAQYPVPLLSYNAANHDDELLSTAGQSGVTLALGDVTIAATNHPAAGGKTGAFKAVAAEAQFDTIGGLLPENAVVLATIQQPKVTDPTATEKVPFVVLIEEGTAGGKTYSGGALAGLEGNDFFAGAGLNKFSTSVNPKSLTLKPIDITGKKNPKLTLAMAATFLDFEPGDFLDVLVDPDGAGPGQFTRLIGFSAPGDNDKFMSDASTHPDNPAKLHLRFQDVSYDLPPNATQLIIRFEAMNNWWNEIVAFDNIRITAGEAAVKPTVAIRRDGAGVTVEFAGVLQSAPSIAGPWTDVANAQSPHAVGQISGAQFFRARRP
ncbi:MAG: hypothetical protein HYY23_18060 [Verrucomicrobia bacterium]|nr:hypothetical protein [Verrucomicrobiota bacterium]